MQNLTNKHVERKLLQEKFAELLGINQSQYSRRENRDKKISKKECNKIINVL